MALLPPRPYGVRTRFVVRSVLGAGVLVAAGAAAAIGFGWLELSEAQQIKRDEALWSRGTEALDSHVQGKARSNHLIFHEYDLNVDFVDQSHGRHHGTVKFSTLGSTVDSASSADVRYDPAQPEQFVLSWAMNVSSGRWAEVIVLGLFLVALGGVMVWFGLMALRSLFDVRRAAERSEEVVVDLLEVVQLTNHGVKTGAHRYRFRVGVGPAGQPIIREVLFNLRKKEQPLYADQHGKKLLALRTPFRPSHPIVLRDDFYPFVLSPAQEKEARQALSSVALVSAAAGALGVE